MLQFFRVKDLQHRDHREHLGEKAMADIQSQFPAKQRRRATIILLAGFAAGCAFLPLAARQQGPMSPPAGTVRPATEPQPKPAATTPAQNGPASAPPQGSSLGPPAVPVDEIIQKFAAREAEFKIERGNFTYTQTFSIQTLDSSGRPDGEYKKTTEVVFTPTGKRFERDTYAPVPTLERINLSQQDLDDLEHVQPFVLTTTELPKYNIKYVDHVQLDELTTYVFDVAPKTLEKNQRYFQGRIWVEDKDLEIVKTDGKAVPDIRKKGEENVFPRFETFRENVEGHFWFPTYTRSNDILHFSSGDIPIRMVVKYENYKRFGVTVKIGTPAKAAEPTEPTEPKK
jgi:hypothetical protein